MHLTGNYQQSIEKMLEVLDIDPDFAMTHRSLSSSYSNLGYRPAGINAIEKAFELSFKASDRERFIIAGDYYRLSEKTFDKAIDAYEQLLEMYPDDSTGLSNLGLTYFVIEDFDRAEQEYKTFGESTGSRRMGLSSLYLTEGKYTEALDILEKSPEISEAAAYINMQNGNLSKALDGFNQSLENSGNEGRYTHRIELMHLIGLTQFL